MTPLVSTPVQTGAAGSQQDAAATPTKVGAFEVPKATSSGQAAAGQSPAKPQTDHVVVNVGTGETRPASKPIEIPKDVQWQKPVTAVRGDIPKSGTVKAVVTFVPDGDTVFGKQSDGSALACRIDGIDAPEVNSKRTGKPGQPYGEESKKTLQDMILNKEVTVRITKPSVNGSNYGRDMCQIEIEGKDADGVSFKLSDYRGKHVIVIFWGGWCHACHGILPLMNETATKFKDKPAAVLGVNTDIGLTGLLLSHTS